LFAYEVFMSTIRLCCVECDRRDYYGVSKVSTYSFDFGPSIVVDDLLQDAIGVDVAPHWYTHFPYAIERARCRAVVCSLCGGLPVGDYN
jgi:hypothetical protein